jgi:dienelactone hydrolase
VCNSMVAVREVTYEADGRRMVGTLALPDGSGNRPAVLIGHDGPGLDEFQKGRAEQLAKLGYVAFALDYHGDGESITDQK